MKRMLRHTGIGLAVATLAAVGATTARPAAADASTLSGCHDDGNHYEVCFTDPGNDKGKVIENRLGQLADATHDGDTIRIALYTWNRTPLAKKIANAHDRGVDVRLVLDEKVQGHAAYALLKKRHVPMTLCTTGKGSCLSTHINHNKFFLFDIDGHKSVAQTSFNETKNQLGKYNNMIRVTGDAKLYAYYLAYWQRLHDKKWHGWTSNDDRHRKGSLGTKAYVFPRKTGDPVAGVLGNVTACRSGDAKIYVAESIFNRSAVKHRLAYLHTKLGCNVKVVVQQKADEEWVQKPTSDGYNLPNAKVRRIMLHHKFIIIDAKYNGSWQRVVLTGSHNLNTNSLRHNDEALLRVRNPFVYTQYHQHFLDIYQLAKGH